MWQYKINLQKILKYNHVYQALKVHTLGACVPLGGFWQLSIAAAFSPPDLLPWQTGSRFYQSPTMVTRLLP